ncbi:multiple sugar transport system permease protein [Cohnella sp. SGD-V74]|jgi:multiple sugar transport system permease protein|uniref:carbohydrate ABC transporter permease n=1 Tax=unclassified Cohnella TaxID=2636738 RepID=UPI000D3F2599|nr:MULTISPECIES: sugar ABC transporter permease [unclassified Cohnella]PRX74336.1 multiple sugar transport system permease protein [Cohnella sp. SGD-V74]
MIARTNMPVRTAQKRTAASRIVRYLSREWSSWLLVVPTIIVFFVFAWQPLVSGIVLSFYKTEGYKAVEFIGLQNYVDVIQNSVFRQTLINSFLYVFWSLVIGFAFPIAVAIIINELRHGKSFFRFAVYFPNMVPAIAASMVWMLLFQPGQNGVLNMLISHLGIPAQGWLQDPSMTIPLIVVTMTLRGFGGTVLLYLASLQGINQELYEAASIDGAGVWRKLFRITLPQISNIVGLMLILQISGVFQVFGEPLVMTEGGPNNASMSLMLQSYFYAFRYFQAGHSMALGVITFLILMVLTVIYFWLDKKFDKEA